MTLPPQKELNSLRSLAQKQAGELAELCAETQDLRATAREQKIMAQEYRDGSRHAEELRLAEGKRAAKAEEMLDATSTDLLELVRAVRESVKKSNAFRTMDEEEGEGVGGLGFLLRDQDGRNDYGEAGVGEPMPSGELGEGSASTRIRLHRTGSLSVLTNNIGGLVEAATVEEGSSALVEAAKKKGAVRRE